MRRPNRENYVMPRRSTEEDLAEFHRVSGCSETLSVVFLNTVPGFISLEGFAEHRKMLTHFSAEKEYTASEIWTGARAVLVEILLTVVNVLRFDPAMGRSILERYKADTGRALWDDVGHPKKFVQAILGRGRIETEDEAQLINEILSDLATSLLTQPQREKASALLAAYETGSAP